MTCNQFNAALKRLGYCKPLPTGGISKGQSEFARQFGLTDRQVRRWSSGQWPVPATISALLNLMLTTNTKPEELKS